ncbi:hypothetical protein C8J56DRAFT_978836 [Mycena floridula]|nr:hypothetical protein C8J56DRAFT_978836 [Mycena floridula]
MILIICLFLLHLAGNGVALDVGVEAGQMAFSGSSISVSWIRNDSTDSDTFFLVGMNAQNQHGVATFVECNGALSGSSDFVLSSDAIIFDGTFGLYTILAFNESNPTQQATALAHTTSFNILTTGHVPVFSSTHVLPASHAPNLTSSLIPTPSSNPPSNSIFKASDSASSSSQSTTDGIITATSPFDSSLPSSFPGSSQGWRVQYPLVYRKPLSSSAPASTTTAVLPSSIPPAIVPQGGLGEGDAGQDLISIQLALNWQSLVRNSTFSTQINEGMPGLIATALAINVTRVHTCELQVVIPSKYAGPADSDDLGTQWMGYIDPNLVDTLAAKVDKGQLDGGNSSGIINHLAQHLVPGSVAKVTDPVLGNTGPTITSTWYIPMPPKSTIEPSISSRRSNTPVIVGSVLGTLASLLLVGFALLVKLRRRERLRLPFTYDPETSEVYPTVGKTPPEDAVETDRQGLDSSATLQRRSSERPDDPDNCLVTRQLSLRSNASTIRQQILREKTEIVTARINALETLVESSSTRLVDAEVEIERLRMENRWLRQQEQSDWALGLTDEPPPAYILDSTDTCFQI